MGLPIAAPVAGLGRRGIAYLVDSLVVGVAYIGLTILFDLVFGPLVETTPDGTALLVVAVNPVRVALELTATLLIDALYFAGCWCRWGATPAQRLLRIRVRMLGGQLPTRGTSDGLPVEAAWRRWAVLAIVPIAVGSLVAGGAVEADVLIFVNGDWFLGLLLSTMVDPLRRGFHDRVARTMVVPVPERPA